MSLTAFLNDLFEHGRVATTAAELTLEDQQSALRVLREFEHHDRANWPTGLPEFSEQVGLWAAIVLYRACHFVVERDADPGVLKRALQAACPLSSTTTACYSADLTLRFLTDVIRLARAAAEADPLVEMLVTFAARWPLSSVGVRGLGRVDEALITQDTCLLKAYVDRIIRKSDVARLSDRQVRHMVQASLGLYPDLAPAISAEIERLATEEPGP